MSRSTGPRAPNVKGYQTSSSSRRPHVANTPIQGPPSTTTTTTTTTTTLTMTTSTGEEEEEKTRVLLVISFHAVRATATAGAVGDLCSRSVGPASGMPGPGLRGRSHAAVPL
eukprot:8324152-Heterocapsa_arctica.AAC.1